MKKSIEIKTIEEWRKIISMLFDMGYVWNSGQKVYYEECFKSATFINLVESQEKLFMYCSRNKEGDLYDIVSYRLDNGVNYRIVKKPTKEWKIEAVYEKDSIKFSAYDKQSVEFIVLLYTIDLQSNTITKSVDVDFILKNHGYSLMNYEFDSEGSIKIQV